MPADILLTIGVDPSQLKSSIQAIQQAIGQQTTPITQELEGIQKKLGQTDNKAKRSLVTMLKWGLGWMVAYGALRKVQEGLMGIVSVGREVEYEMAQIKMVSEATAIEYEHLEKSIFDTAKTFGISVTDVAKGAKIWCYDDKTEVFTDEGWKLFKDIIGTEKVLSLDPVNNKSIYQKITNKFSKYYEGEMYLYDSLKMNFCVTPNHKCLVKTRTKKNKTKYTNWSLREIKNLPYVFKVNKTFDWDSDKKNNIDFIKFLAWFIAEGYVHKKNEIVIYQKDENNTKEIIDIIKNLYNCIVTKCKDKRNGTYSISFRNLELANYLRNNCYINEEHISKNKKIPNEIKELSKECIKIFLDTFVMGDGCQYGNGKIRDYMTSSKTLADDIQELSIKSGKYAVIRKRNGTGFSKKSICYKVRETKSREFLCLRKKIKHINYKGFIYCLTTPYHTLYVRRDGHCHWSGNSQQGKEMAEVQELTRTAMIGVNITGQDSTTVISNLTGALNIYNISADEAIGVMDKWIYVANKYSIEAGELADGLLRVGTTAVNVGVSLDELNGYLTAVHDITRRELPVIGTAFRTIFTRMARPAVLEFIQSLTDIPIYMKNGLIVTDEATTTYRDFSDIIDDLAGKWETLAQTEKMDLAERIAGVRQMETFLALMDNYGVALSARIVSEGAAGEAMKANSEIMVTFEKQVKQLSASMAELGNAIFKGGLGDVLKNAAYGLNALVKNISELDPMIVQLTIHVVLMSAALWKLAIAIKASKLSLGSIVAAIILLIEVFAVFGALERKNASETEKLNKELETLGSKKGVIKSIQALAEEFQKIYKWEGETATKQKLLNQIVERYNILAGDQKIAAGDMSKAYETMKGKVVELTEEMKKLNRQEAENLIRRTLIAKQKLKEEFAKTTGLLGGQFEKIGVKVDIENIDDMVKVLGSAAEELEKNPIIGGAVLRGLYNRTGIKLLEIQKEWIDNKQAMIDAEIKIQDLLDGNLEKEKDAYEIEADRLEKKQEMLNYELEIGRILGLDKVTLAGIKLAEADILDIHEGSVEYMRLQHEFNLAILEDTYKLAETLKQDVAGGLFDIIKNTGTWQDMLNNIGDTILKENIANFLDQIEDATGIFKTISAGIRGPIVQQHIAGIEAGAKIINSAHLVAIEAGAKILETAHIKGITEGFAIAYGQGEGTKAISGNLGTIVGGKGGLEGVKADAKAINDAIYDKGGLKGVKADAKAINDEIYGKRGLEGVKADAKAINDEIYGDEGMSGAEAGTALATAAMAAYSAYQSGSPVSGAITGAMAGMGIGTMILPGIGTAIGAAIGAITGALAGALGADRGDKSTVQEQTQQITNEIHISNKKLDIVNRNLSAIRDKLEPYSMPESFFFASSQARGWMR